MELEIVVTMVFLIALLSFIGWVMKIKSLPSKSERKAKEMRQSRGVSPRVEWCLRLREEFIGMPNVHFAQKTERDQSIIVVMCDNEDSLRKIREKSSNLMVRHKTAPYWGYTMSFPTFSFPSPSVMEILVDFEPYAEPEVSAT